MKLKVFVKDDDGGWSSSDDVDGLVQLLRPTPARSASVAAWTTITVHGLRPRHKTRSVVVQCLPSLTPSTIGYCPLDESNYVYAAQGLICPKTSGGSFTSPYLPPALIALPFRNGMSYHNRNKRVNSANDVSILCENFMKFGPVTPELTLLICERQLRHGQKTGAF